MDTRSNGTFPESEQPGSAAAEGSYTHAVSGLSRPFTVIHISQRRRGSSDLSGDSSRRGGRPLSRAPSRGNPYPRHSNRTSSATGNSAYLAPRTNRNRESKGPPDSYFLEIASEIRELEQQWTTLEAASTPELHKLVVKVSTLVREFSVNPEKRTENEATYRSLWQLHKEETERLSILLRLIPSLKTELARSEYVDFDGLVDTLTGRKGHNSDLYTGRLGPVQQVDNAEPTQEITAPELPEPDPRPSCGFLIKLLSFPCF